VFMNEIITILEKLGLEQQEVKTYLALLDLGEATATKLAERTGLGRVHMYQIVNRLIEKGIASYIIKNNVKYFSASDPEALLKDIQQKEQDLQKIIPELKARQNRFIHETKVEIFRGREGINTILKMVVRDQKQYYILGGSQEACSLFKLENIIMVRNAERAKLSGKILARENDLFFIGNNEDFRFIPNDLISSTTQMLWGTKTAIFVWTEPYYAILVDNKEVTEGNIATFRYLWRKARIPSKKDRLNRKIKL